MFLIEIQEPSLMGPNLLPWETMPPAPTIQLQQYIEVVIYMQTPMSSLILNISLPHSQTHCCLNKDKHVIIIHKKGFPQCVYKLPFSGISPPFLSPGECLLTEDPTCRELPADGKCIVTQIHRHTHTHQSCISFQGKIPQAIYIFSET